MVQISFITNLYQIHLSFLVKIWSLHYTFAIINKNIVSIYIFTVIF